MLMVKPLENRAEKKSPHLDPRWEYDKMCLSTGGDAISIPKVPVFWWFINSSMGLELLGCPVGSGWIKG